MSCSEEKVKKLTKTYSVSYRKLKKEAHIYKTMEQPTPDGHSQSPRHHRFCHFFISFEFVKQKLGAVAEKGSTIGGDRGSKSCVGIGKSATPWATIGEGGEGGEGGDGGDGGDGTSGVEETKEAGGGCDGKDDGAGNNSRDASSGGDGDAEVPRGGALVQQSTDTTPAGGPGAGAGAGAAETVPPSKEEEEEKKEEEPCLWLEAVAGCLKGQTWAVETIGATLGRASDNNLSLADKEMSRRHSKVSHLDWVLKGQSIQLTLG